MPVCHLAKAVQRHVACPPQTVPGETVAAAVQALCDREPRLRGYLLDDQGQLRQHVELFVNGRRVRDRGRLTDPVGPTDQIHIFQALSGG
ncbi:MAG: MoaD/ThiS family protein [Fimbriimonadaceae bacterium]|nr:MoaD/ThiS family protein [Fimbriimonadaceae bacterium]